MIFFTMEQTEISSALEPGTFPNAAAVVVMHAQLHHWNFLLIISDILQLILNNRYSYSLPPACWPAIHLVQMRHGAVKGIQELVLQEVRITEVPPTPALLQAASIACK